MFNMRIYKNSTALALVLMSLTLIGCSNPEQKEAKYLKAGNEYFSKGKYEKARIEYKNAARVNPTDPEVSYRFAILDEAEGNIRGAFGGFGQAEQQNAHYEPALIKLAEYYIAGEQYDEAEKRIETVLADTPDDAEGHALKAALYLHQKNFDGAHLEIEKSFKKDPTNVSAYSVLTGVYETQEDQANAEKTIEEATAKNPEALSLYLLKARVYEKAKDFTKVTEAYQTIFKLKPNERRYRTDLASIYIRNGQLDEAEGTLRTAITAMPDDWDMKHELVNFLGDHRSLETAEKEIHSLMDANPKHDELYSWLIDLYVRHNAIDHAVTYLNQIIAKNQFDKEGLNARTSMARIDYVRGDKAATEQLVTEVLDHDPKNLDALFIKANLLADKGQYEDAVTDLHTIIRDRPNSKEALQLLSETLLTQGHLDLAIDTLNQLLEKDPLNESAQVRLAQMYDLNGDPKHAMDLLFLTTRADPKFALAWESIARISIETKNWSTANSAIDALDKLEGQHMTATLLRGQVLANTGKQSEAVTDLKEVIGTDPGSTLSEHALGTLIITYQGMSKLDEAVAYIESLKTESPIVKTMLGECYVGLGKKDAAAAAFDKAIASNSNRQEPYLDRAKLYIDAQKPADAVEILKKGALAAPSDLRASLMEASILATTGQFKDSIDLYQSLLDRNPSLDLAANNMADLIADHEYQDNAQLEKARLVAERFVASPNPLLLDTLGWVYYRQGNIQQAESITERGLSLRAKVPPVVHYHYGAIYLKAGKTDEAKAELQQALVDGAQYPGLDDAKKMLSGLK